MWRSECANHLRCDRRSPRCNGGYVECRDERGIKVRRGPEPSKSRKWVPLQVVWLPKVLSSATRCCVIRDGVVVYTGKLGSLKLQGRREEVRQGFECGLNIANFNDIKVGDVVEAYTLVGEAYAG